MDNVKNFSINVNDSRSDEESAFNHLVLFELNFAAFLMGVFAWSILQLGYGLHLLVMFYSVRWHIMWGMLLLLCAAKVHPSAP